MTHAAQPISLDLLRAYRKRKSVFAKIIPFVTVGHDPPDCHDQHPCTYHDPGIDKAKIEQGVS